MLWIVCSEFIYGVKGPFSQRHGPPLGHSLAGGGGSVAEGSEIRYILPFSADIFVENVIYDPAYGFIDGTPLYEILVVGSAVRDVKVVPARSVPRNHHWFGVAQKNHSG